jgi:hypothetical protein
MINMPVAVCHPERAAQAGGESKDLLTQCGFSASLGSGNGNDKETCNDRE